MSIPRRSNYYQDNAVLSDDALAARIGGICLEFSGYVYCRVTEELHRQGSRKAIGYALSREIDTNLTIKALLLTINDRRPSPGHIHHQDRGIHYASTDYVKELAFHGFQISMSRKGNPYDNAYAESFIKTLKSEKVKLWEYRTIEDARQKFA